MVRGRFEPHRVGALAQVQPLEERRELGRVELQLEVDPQAFVDQPGPDQARPLGFQSVLVDLLDEARQRSRHLGVGDALFGDAVTAPQGAVRRQLVAGALVQEGPADVDVVEVHVRRRVEARVAHPVDQADLRTPEVGLDAAGEPQVLAEDGRLAHLALGPQHAAAVRLPPLAVPGQPGREVGDPAVQGVHGRAPRRVAVLRGVHLAAEERVVETRGEQQPREAAHHGQAVVVAVLVQSGVAEARRRAPAEATALELGPAQVHGPVHQHVEREPAAGTELQCADAAFGAVVQDDGPDPARRAQIARVPGEGLPVVGASVQLHAITHPPLTSTHWPVTKEASGPVRKDTTEASSSGRPRRFSAWWSSTCRRYASGSSWISSAAVGKAPGETQLTRISAGPSSLARARVGARVRLRHLCRPAHLHRRPHRGGGRPHRHSGQPSTRAAWTDPATVAADFYRRVTATCEQAWVRPRHAGYIGFQGASSAAVRAALAGETDHREALDRRRTLYRTSRTPKERHT